MFMRLLLPVIVAIPRFIFLSHVAAFVESEFAKEAMQGQSLDQGEILSIRWAYDDPNPVAQDSISRADKDALTGLLAAKGVVRSSISPLFPPCLCLCRLLPACYRVACMPVISLLLLLLCG